MTPPASATLPNPTRAVEAHQATQPTNTPAGQAQVTPTSTSTASPVPIEPLVIGTSVAGRPIQVYAFGSGPIHRLLISGIHGGYESNTIQLADQLIQILRSRPDLIPDDVTLYILRALNPDGEARSSSYKGRVNENLVDLNRNWPSQWQKTWPLEGCWTYTYVTGGSYPASEPETRALMNFLLTYQVDALINYHSAALGIFPGGQPPDARSIALAEMVAQISDYPYPPIETGCQYTGQLIDWASDQGIAAIDIELTNHQDTDLIQNLRILSEFVGWEIGDVR
jgi:predicted deacylase